MKIPALLAMVLLGLVQACGLAPSPVSVVKNLDLTEGRYFIKTVGSGLCLESPGNSKAPGTRLRQWPCNESDAQIFTLNRVGRGFRIANHDGSLALDVTGISREPGTPIQYWSVNDGEQQQFIFDHSSQAGKYFIRSVLSGHVFDVEAMSKEPDAKVIQWKETGTDNQLFTIERVRESDGWKLVWSDEFSGDRIDASKWDFDLKAPGWVNHELQNYTNRPENARLENGNLIIEARRDNFDGHEYSSARLKTQGKASWTYGRVEARIQLPWGVGTWPAFWMMPDDQSRGWPACGEIDIMEHVGYDQDWINATTHSESYSWKSNSQRTAKTHVEGVSQGFHIYKLEWYPDRIDMFVDDVKYYTSPNDGTGDNAYPFTKNFHVILNLAVGGDWGGARGVDGNIWSQQMKVDYVRVYQR